MQDVQSVPSDCQRKDSNSNGFHSNGCFIVNLMEPYVDNRDVNALVNVSRILQDD